MQDRSYPGFPYLWQLLACAALLLTLARCAGPAAPPIQPAAPAPTPPPPAYLAYYFDADGLQRYDTRAAEPTLLLPTATYQDARAVSPDGRLLALAYTRQDSTRLAVVDATRGRLTEVHAAPGEVVYTPAWRADGAALAFGYYTPRRNGTRTSMGPGGVQVATGPAWTTRDVGCSVSKTVAHWHPGGDLIVGDGDNLYVVDAGDCRTLATIPARKKHHVAFSPDGAWMSYLYRDLVYNRDRRAYEPESTLFVADYRGLNERKVVSHRYSPQHMAWSPQSDVLAFDVRSQADPARRHISLFDVTTGQNTYLIPPDEGGHTRETTPRWSPAGSRIAFARTQPGDAAMPDSTRQVVVRTFMDRFLQVVATIPPDAAWSWAGEDALLLTGPAGARLVPVADAPPLPLPDGATYVYTFHPAPQEVGVK